MSGQSNIDLAIIARLKVRLDGTKTHVSHLQVPMGVVQTGTTGSLTKTTKLSVDVFSRQ